MKTGVEDMARLVERKYPQLNDQLISAVEFSDGQAKPWESPALMKRVVHGAGEAVRGLSFKAALDHRRAGRRGLVIGSVLVAMIAVFLVSPVVMGLWFRRNVLLRDVDWPQRTYLTVLGVEVGPLVLDPAMCRPLIPKSPRQATASRSPGWPTAQMAQN